MMSSKAQQFDGFSVTVYEGKFAGGFDLDEDFASDLRFDDVVTFIVTGRIGGVSLGETKLGDLKRVNAFQVTSAVALDPQTATKVLNSMGQMVDGVNGGQLTIDQPDVTATLDTTSGSEPMLPVEPRDVKDAVLADFLSSNE
jgi:hypothetical protein